VTSLDYDDTGELAIICRSDDTLQIYNCREGKHAKDLKSQKYGAHLARFTHQGSAVLYASTKVDGKFDPDVDSYLAILINFEMPSDTSQPTTIPSFATSRATQTP
jgi:hypothetical protein